MVLWLDPSGWGNDRRSHGHLSRLGGRPQRKWARIRPMRHGNRGPRSPGTWYSIPLVSLIGTGGRLARIGGRAGRIRARSRVGVAVRGRLRTGSGLPICFWVVQPQRGQEELGCADQGDVAVPAGPGAAFEVVQAEAGRAAPERGRPTDSWARWPGRSRRRPRWVRTVVSDFCMGGPDTLWALGPAPATVTCACSPLEEVFKPGLEKKNDNDDNNDDPKISAFLFGAAAV
jgi:hypothetical protein